ncbi:MAG: FAD:protein FMN transferase [Calditrichaceae bacterium]|nr:FAD:protein FMN transferase [Calditrichaceae bacterium]MBN2707412.1 FAD:protein FMN transferase [Calditrichaceae bacterium]RQV96955.1 MAG: FAD:protein FMN transferase [Calditrichota bacterium]
MNRFLLILSLVILISACKEENKILRGRTMGTTYMINTTGKSAGKELQVKVDQCLQEINRQMSAYQPESEISLFNAKRDTMPFIISPSFGSVLKLARQINLESAGAFDVTVAPLVDLWGFGRSNNRSAVPEADAIAETRKRVGMEKLKIINDTTIAKINPLIELDLSAIAKGYGVDAVAELLDREGYENYLVEIGGEIYARGDNNGQPWKLGIDRPEFGAVPGQHIEAVISIGNQAVATSGDYRNYFIDKDSVFCHTIDPVSGKPIINGVASVTVVAPDCALADAMATAIMVMGVDRSLAWVESNPDVECFIITRVKNGYVEQMSSGFAGLIVN